MNQGIASARYPAQDLEAKVGVTPRITHGTIESETKMLHKIMGKRLLIVANAYPSDSAIYRNGFIHRRVKSYQGVGYDVTVYYLHPPATTQSEYVFDGVNVVLGNELTYATYVRIHEYDAYLIHFVTPAMISPIKKYHPNGKVVVWIHGFEAEAWHRRWFNFIDGPDKIREAIHRRSTYYASQTEFLKWLYTTTEMYITFVQISEWFQKRVVEPDAGTIVKNSHVIPNMIDTQVFDYKPKRPSQRLRLLSIRPYASRKYANDLTVDAIRILSRKPYFDDLEFAIYGEGRLFRETTEPLQQFSNVQVSQTFLTQTAIAEVHKQYGVFICPTRFDSQGVSMCEAMSSGLVVISSDVSAIPEFVSHNQNGLLGSSESAEDIAFWIERLYYNSDLFERISYNAQEYVRANLSNDIILRKEIGVIEAR